MSGCDAICIKETDSSSVYLVLACGSFDREQKSEYNLFFTMKSRGEQLLEIPVFFEVITFNGVNCIAFYEISQIRILPNNFQVLDVNDNAPKFEKSVIRVMFNRSTTHYKLVRIQASDLDSGENGRIHYTLSDTNLFEIESDTGILNIHENVRLSFSFSLFSNILSLHSHIYFNNSFHKFYYFFA